MYILHCLNKINYVYSNFRNEKEKITRDMIKDFFDYYVLTVKENVTAQVLKENKEINDILNNIYEKFTKNIFGISGSINYIPNSKYHIKGQQTDFDTKEIIIEFLNYIIYFVKFPNHNQSKNLEKILYFIFNFPRISNFNISGIPFQRNLKNELEFVKEVCKSMGNILGHIYNLNNSSYEIISNLKKQDQDIENFYSLKALQQFSLNLSKTPLILDISKISTIIDEESALSTLPKVLIILGFFLSILCCILYFIFISNLLFRYIIFSIHLILLIFLGYKGYSTYF